MPRPQNPLDPNTENKSVVLQSRRESAVVSTPARFVGFFSSQVQKGFDLEVKGKNNNTTCTRGAQRCLAVYDCARERDANMKEKRTTLFAFPAAKPNFFFDRTDASEKEKKYSHEVTSAFYAQEMKQFMGKKKETNTF